MIAIPNPLHPAIVHFPIVLILIGSLLAVAAAVVRRWHLPWLTAAFLIGGAVGAAFATLTGKQQAEMVGIIPDRLEALLEEHEEWGEQTRNLAIVAALLAVASASLARFPKVARGTGVVTALVAVAAAYSVAETGHLGGQLVYKHGIGINTSAENNPANPRPAAKHGDD